MTWNQDTHTAGTSWTGDGSHGGTWNQDSTSSTVAGTNSHSRFLLESPTPGGINFAPAVSTAVPWYVSSTDPIKLYSSGDTAL